MSFPNKDGRYIALPVDWTIEEKTNDLNETTVQFIVQFNLSYFWDGANWQDVRQQGLSIRGYFFVIKKDGTPNITTVNNLKASLGWDGSSLASLNDSDWGQQEVQITVRTGEYKGKQNQKVEWIAPRDSDPNSSLAKAEPQFVSSLDSRYGSSLRAIGGGSVASAVKSPLPPPTTPRPPQPPASGALIGPTVAAGATIPRPAASAPPAGTKAAAWVKFQSLWATFVAANHEYDDKDKKAAAWKDALAVNFAGRDEKSITAEDWIAFSDVFLPAFDLSGIPF